MLQKLQKNRQLRKHFLAFNVERSFPLFKMRILVHLGLRTCLPVTNLILSSSFCVVAIENRVFYLFKLILITLSASTNAQKGRSFSIVTWIASCYVAFLRLTSRFPRLLTRTQIKQLSIASSPSPRSARKRARWPSSCNQSRRSGTRQRRCARVSPPRRRSWKRSSAIWKRGWTTRRRGTNHSVRRKRRCSSTSRCRLVLFVRKNSGALFCALVVWQRFHCLLEPDFLFSLRHFAGVSL